MSPLDVQFGVFLGAAVRLAITPGQGIGRRDDEQPTRL